MLPAWSLCALSRRRRWSMARLLWERKEEVVACERVGILNHRTAAASLRPFAPRNHGSRRVVDGDGGACSIPT
jgi:hypothetical protein